MKFIILFLPYFFYLVAFYFNSWIIFIPNNSFFLVLFITFLSYVFRRQIYFNLLKLNLKLCILVFFTFSLAFPVRNVHLGDGILLLESVFIESKLVGFQLVMDEFLTTFLQSKFFLLFNTLSVRESYSILSYIFGIFSLITFYFFLNKKSIFLFLIFFFNHGFLVFQGYAENYSIPFFFLFITMTYGFYLIKNKKTDLKYSIILSILAAISAMTHLVNGYMILGLIYFVYYSKKNFRDFLTKSILSSLVSLSILLSVFIWFKFFSQIRIENSQTHFFNPPFYPLKRIISTNHFKEIIQCILFTALMPFSILMYFYLYKKQKLKEILKKSEYKFIFFFVIGFLLHSFLLNPLLGFPADWDLMSFFYFPLSFFAFILWKNLAKFEQIYFLPLIIFSILIYIFNSYFLNQKKRIDEKNLKISMKTAENYVNFRKDKIDKILPINKKFFLRIDYFLYKRSEKLKNLNEETAIKLKSSIQNFRIRLEKISTIKEKKQLLKDLEIFNSNYQIYMGNL